LKPLKAAGDSAELIVKKGGGHPWLTIPDEVKLMADWFDKLLTGLNEFSRRDLKCCNDQALEELTCLVRPAFIRVGFSR
jgi:hypothetical protein